MQFERVAARQNISGELQSAVQAMILDGTLPAAGRINEVRLAEQLGVSRTPLREALHRLAAEDILQCIPRRGFFVSSLSEREFCDIYSIRPILDPAALALAGLPTAARIEKLETLNSKLIMATDAAKAIDLDDAWHLELLADCPNRMLMDMIRRLIRKTRRYELAYFRVHANVKTATKEHKPVIAALRDGALEKACKALKQNLTTGKEPIRKWLADLNGTGEAQST